MTGYSVKVKESSRELNARERIIMKDTTNAIKLDDIIKEKGDKFVMTPVAYAVLEIHNEKAEGNKDYDNYVIVGDNGNKYITGSPSFWDAFSGIWEELTGETDEPFEIEVYKMDSKNYKGKQFLTCSVI